MIRVDRKGAQSLRLRVFASRSRRKRSLSFQRLRRTDVQPRAARPNATDACGSGGRDLLTHKFNDCLQEQFDDDGTQCTLGTSTRYSPSKLPTKAASVQLIQFNL